jgi:predicted transcriptional regulator
MKNARQIKKAEFLSVRVSKEIKDRLEKMASSQERSLSWLVAKVLEEFMTKPSGK